MKINIWHEDNISGSAASKFMKFILPKDKSKYEVRGFGGNVRLMNHMAECRFSSDELYLILIDGGKHDGIPDIIKNINDIANKYKNVYVWKEYVCFEYMILSFDSFDEWINTNRNVNGCDCSIGEMRRLFLEKCNGTSRPDDDTKIAKYIAYKMHIDTDNVGWENLVWSKVSEEDISTNILRLLAKQGFLVRKTELGKCWTCTCDKNCDICISTKKECICNIKCLMDSSTKKESLYEGTQLKAMLLDTREYFKCQGFKFEEINT